MKYLLILTFLFIKCNSQNKNIIPVTKSFKVVHSDLINENDLDKYELADYGKIRNEQAPIGDQISRMWQNFGKPETIMFEGFDYYIQDEKVELYLLLILEPEAQLMLRQKMIFQNECNN